MYFVMAESELMPLSQSETITGLEEVCDEYCQPVDILSAWRSKFYVLFIDLSICLYCMSHSILYCTEIISYISRFLVSCWLPKNITLLSQSTIALILSVFCNTQNVTSNQLKHLANLLLLRLCRIVVIEVLRWDWQMSPRFGLERQSSLACSSAFSDLDTFKKEEFAKVVAVLWFWFALSS